MTKGSYPDSVDSSPRSRGGNSWTDEHYSSSIAAPPAKLRFMCSYGGQIVPRQHDKTLCYVGGETRMVVVDRYNTTLADLSAKLSRSLLSGRPFSLKYQLPSEDLDSLISVTTDEDLDNMIDEYDRLLSPTGIDPKTGASSNSKQNRLRLFLFPSKPDDAASSSSIGSLLDDFRSESWFVDALNNATGDASSIDSLHGLGEESNSSVQVAILGSDKAEEEVRMQQQLPLQLDTSSSDLLPIRIGVEEQRFGGINLGSEGNRFARLRIKEQEATVTKEDATTGLHHGHHSHLPTPLTSINVVPVSVSAVATSTVPGFSSCNENIASSAPRVVLLDDEKPPEKVGIRLPLQNQQPISDRIVPVGAGVNVESGPKLESQHALSDSGCGDQVPEQGYTASMHPEQFQQLQQQQLQQRQHYIHNNPQFTYQQTSTPVVPSQSYQQMHHPIQTQQPFTHPNPCNQQIPMYFMPIRQNQSYMIPMQQQTNLGDAAQLGAPANTPTMPILNPLVPPQGLPLPKPELGAPPAAGVYGRTVGTASANSQHLLPAQFFQLGDQGHRYAGCHHHPSQPAPFAGGYGYDSALPQQPTMYHSQTSSVPLPPQYQTNSTLSMMSNVHPPLQQSNLKRTV